MSTSQIIASEVTISTLRGYKYPTTNSENEMFRVYFQDTREVRKGGYIYLSNILLCSGQERYVDFELYPYKVVIIQGINEESQSTSIEDFAITSRQKTKVVLEGISVDNSQYAVHICSYFFSEILKPTSIFSSITAQTYLNVRYSPFSEQFHQFEISPTVENWQDLISSEISRYRDKANQLINFDSMNEQEIDFLRHILPKLRSSSTPPIQSILVDCAKSMEKAVEESLFNLSLKLGLRFLTTESRLLAVSRQKSSALPLHGHITNDSTSSKSPQHWSPLSADVIQQSTGAKGILLYITNWDLIVEQSKSPLDQSGSTPSKNDSQPNIHQESLVDVTCQCLLDFQQELLDHSKTPTPTNSGGRDHPIIIIVAVTNSSTAWLPHWKKHHSLCRQAFPVLWTPPSISQTMSIEEHLIGTQKTERTGDHTTNNIHFSTEAMQLLSQAWTDLQDDHHCNIDGLSSLSAASIVKSFPLAASAIQEALTRVYGWTALMDMLPTIEDTSHISHRLPPWQRLLYQSTVNIVNEQEQLVVLLEDVQRAFHVHFPYKPVPPITVHVPSSSNQNDGLDNSINTLAKSQQKKKQKKKQSNQHIEPVYWADIGGLDRVRHEILDVLELPFHHPELFPPHAPRRQGVLLYGPPGTGKTLVAKAVATECNMAFLSVKGPELLDAYVGESEKNVRDLFARARRMAPCVLFFDEIDSLAPARAKRNDSGGGVTDRIVSQLLTELDLLVSGTNNHHPPPPSSSTSSLDTHNNNNNNNNKQKMNQKNTRDTPHGEQPSAVFVIAATNRPDLLDPALLRPGRFDRKIYLGVCSDITARQAILTAQSRKFQLAEDVDFAAIATHCLPKYVTGADLGAVSSSAYSSALERKLQELETLRNEQDGGAAGAMMDMDETHLDFLDAFSDEMLRVVVTQADFETAARRLVPSVVDLSYYEELHAKYDSSAGTA